MLMFAAGRYKQDVNMYMIYVGTLIWKDIYTCSLDPPLPHYGSYVYIYRPFSFSLLPIEPKVSSSTLKQLFTCTAANTRFNTHSLVHARQHIVLVLRLIHLGVRSLQRGRGGGAVEFV